MTYPSRLLAGMTIVSSINALEEASNLLLTKSRSPGRAMRRHRNGKHILPREWRPCAIVQGNTLYVHPSLYKKVQAAIDNQHDVTLTFTRVF